MNRDKVVLVIVVFAFLTFCACFENGKRHLVFNKGSKFFVRFNVKEDVLKASSGVSFAHTVGYKMSWDLPHKVDDYGLATRRIRKRDLYRGISEVLVAHDIDGKMCLRRFWCEARFVLNDDDFARRLFKMVFTPNEEDIDGEDLGELPETCDAEFNDCPVSLVAFANES